MKYPYGIADFRSIIREKYFYCDRTDKIPLLENTKSQLFIRPRRFGKSLVLSMLENYYDVAKKDEFEEIFGGLKIGKNPTDLRNSYFILKLDFSCVDPTGSAEDVKKALFNHINACIIEFYKVYNYKGFELPAIEIDREDALFSMKSLITSARMTPYPVYLLIDEYDNFANTVMMGVQSSEGRYKALVHEEGPLRTFFKAVKASTSSSMFDRVFITGVSPVVMSDITSGYNIAENIYFEPEFNDLCGFKQNEIEDVLKKIVDECGFEKEKIKEAVSLMQTYYNGYIFSHTADEQIYNPTLCLYFFKQFEKSCNYPREMLDDNLAVDEAKLKYIAQIPKGSDLLMSLMEKEQQVVAAKISKRFGIEEMLTDKSRDNTFLVSFLYYFGVLTIAGDTEDLQVILKVPNLVMQSLYVERVQKMLLPEPDDRDNGKLAAEKVYQKGDMAPLCRFMEERYFKVFHNRDYRWANELTVKTAFLTLLYNDIIYIMDSEKEIDRRYADLTMIIRPDKRYGKIFDVLIEFKFIKLKDAGISAEQAKKLSEDELCSLSEIVKQMKDGKKQVKEYGKKLEQRHGNLRLQKFVVAALGFERVCFKKI
ncbi:AAA family ATPase [Desulfosarcina sp. BuS5]|uniref:AAA family ATPase n=2 Tax=Desulfosarcina sp. BuS5 TaxID=933262 RepID=UPI00237942E6|nr:AAA family ATPase [Desulfosarcina sp. BuS5]